MDGFLLGGIQSAHATTPWHNVPLLAGGAPEKHLHGILPQARHNDAPARHRREAFVQRFIANETCVVPVRHQRGAFAQSPATSETYNGTPARHGRLKEMARAAAFASKQQLGQFFSVPSKSGYTGGQYGRLDVQVATPSCLCNVQIFFSQHHDPRGIRNCCQDRLVFLRGHWGFHV